MLEKLVAGSNPALAFKFEMNKMFLPCSLLSIPYCGEPPWPRSSELGLKTVRVRISNCVSGGQCHLIYLTILRRFSWHSLTYMCMKVAWYPIHFISFIHYKFIQIEMFAIFFKYKINNSICLLFKLRFKWALILLLFVCSWHNNNCPTAQKKKQIKRLTFQVSRWCSLAM